jgi:putative polymerase
MFASTTSPAAAYGAHRQVSSGAGDNPAEGESAFIQRMVFMLVLAATVYQTALCFLHTHVTSVTGAIVGAAEFVIYTGCFLLLVRRLRLDFIAVIFLLFAYLLLLAALRSYIDFKSYRDLMIPILFYWIGRTYGTMERADRILKALVLIVLAFGFFELVALDLYSRVFNTFSYYVSQGGLSGTTNWAKGSSLALNGMRPDGIGRTILPMLLGSHRISSIFMEPVSLGNFAVITAAWGLAKGREDRRKTIFFLVSSAIMITLADSRYGMMTVMLLVFMRFAFIGKMNTTAIVLPLVSIALLLAIAILKPGAYGDTFMGRLAITGNVLLKFNYKELVGLAGYTINFGDMGYAVALTRFGIVLCAIVWIGFWLIKMRDIRGLRFRAYVSLYACLILMISGTSLFALKTAGVLWFLVGCCALKQSHEARKRFDLPPSAAVNEPLKPKMEF